MKKNRQLNWVSSAKGQKDILKNLDEKMQWFYGQQDGRELYQSMLDGIDEELPPEGSVGRSLIDYVCKLGVSNLVEVGCANGRLFRQLKKAGYAGRYTGLEVADYIIQNNRKRNPDADWHCAPAYSIPSADGEFDVCLSFYVIEHLVYPEKALEEMMRVVKEKGQLILVFPDFVAVGRFPSQQLGFRPGNWRDKLKKAQILDAAVTFYDGRVRLPKSLKAAVQNIGAFPININPICLVDSKVMGDDVDAIYISSKNEIRDWAASKGYIVEFPAGIEAPFDLHSFIVIKK